MTLKELIYLFNGSNPIVIKEKIKSMPLETRIAYTLYSPLENIPNEYKNKKVLFFRIYNKSCTQKNYKTQELSELHIYISKEV